jgi:SpoVK/Ycf46/Vps4 family AAA+-type ATPase
MKVQLPSWANEMCDLFRSGSTAQFILHGNVFDVIPAELSKGASALSVQEYLQEIMFSGYDVVLRYDRGKGIRAVRGEKDWSAWFEQFSGLEGAMSSTIREPGRALEIIDRYLLRTLNLQAIQSAEAGQRKIAVIIDFAEFVVPQGNALQLGGEFSANVVKVLGWANDPAILRSNIVTVLIAEGLHDLNELVVENPHCTKLKIPLPDEEQMRDYLQMLSEQSFSDLQSKCDVPMETLSRRLTGLSRVGARTVLSLALKKEGRITTEWLSKMKKSMIERECQGLLEFLESPYTLDHVAGHEAVKTWLREDTTLIRRNVFHALPMGYLITGRIGTGKTFIVQCWAGELGIPCLVFKNFRDRWVGATESNLEKIFSILHALGQVLVFVDEADQAAGKREGGDGDSGLSGRIYGMLAKEMSDTRNRGRIIWIFATSRPDLLEVDLKRQGRLDVHIPLFAPQTSEEMRVLFCSVAKKLKFPLTDQDIPDLPKKLVLGGNEVEGVLVRALRVYELAADPRPTLKEILAQTLTQVRPSAHTRKLEYMDLVAVRECTDERFLTPQFKDISPEKLEQRIDELRRFV